MKREDIRVRRLLRFRLPAISCLAGLAGAAELIYQGRSVSDWLNDLGNTPATEKYLPAAVAFRGMGTNAVPFLLSKLESDRPERPNQLHQDSALVVNAFGEIGPQASNAAPKLSELLFRESSAPWAAAALVAIHAETPVVDLLSRTNGPLRRAAIIALASRSVGKAAIPPLLTLLRDTDAETRHLVAWVLGQIGKEEALTVPALMRAAADPDSWVRHHAIQALGNFESQAVVVHPALLRGLTDTNAYVRKSAAGSLGGMMNQFLPNDRKKIVGALIQALRDKEEGVQSSAAWALGTPLPENKEAFPPLLELTKTSSKTVSNAAAAALKHIDREAALKAGIQ